MPRKRKEAGERRIDFSQRGRVYWRPGEAHPLDALAEDVAQLRQHLTQQLQHLRIAATRAQQRIQTFLETTSASDPRAFFSGLDRAAHQELTRRFLDRKHFYHLRLAFSRQRYKRLLGKMQAIQAALDLATALFEDEAALLTPPDIQEEESTPAAEPPPLPERPAEDLDKETRRLQGIHEPLTALTGSTEQARQLLTAFEAKLPELRQLLASGQGWFEVFYVPKRTYKATVVAYAKALKAWRERQRPIPPEIEQALHPEVARLLQLGATSFPSSLRDEVYDVMNVGPYVKYRWTEAKRTYTISLGLDDDYPPYPFVPEGF